MKAGDYVRYVKCKYKEKSQDVRIAKIKDIQTETGYNQKFIFFENGNGEYENYIIKSSPNTIDLIEYGDIVKYKIDDEEFISEVRREKNNYFVQNFDVPIDLIDLNIVSIVTKEAFENMEYKVGDE